MITANKPYTDGDRMTINIIYVRGTVERLLPFLSTLLKHSICNFRLASNACSKAENSLLKKYAQTEERVSFIQLSANRVWPHDEVLMHLLTIENTPWFAFMDSDIFAKGSFLSELTNALEGKDAVFTGLPLWHESSELQMPEEFKIMGGRYFKSHNDYLLGLSYMAIYKTRSLKDFMNTSGIDFRRYYWNEIPAKHQSTISQLGLRKHMYDTAKVLNILWQHHGGIMAYKEVDNLIHLGGVSGEDSRGGFIMNIKQNILRLVPALLSTSVKYLFRISDRITFRERMNIERLVKKRRISASLLRQSLYSASTEADMKAVSFLGPAIVQKFKNAIEVIIPALEDFYQKDNDE